MSNRIPSGDGADDSGAGVGQTDPGNDPIQRAYARPGLTMGGLADGVSRGRRTEEEVRRLLEKGCLKDECGLELTAKGLACIDSASLGNRMMRIGKGALGVALSVLSVLIGNWIWSLIQSSA